MNIFPQASEERTLHRDKMYRGGSHLEESAVSIQVTLSVKWLAARAHFFPKSYGISTSGIFSQILFQLHSKQFLHAVPIPSNPVG